MSARKSSLLAIAVSGLLAVAASAPANADWRGAQLNWQYYAYGGPFDGGGSPGQCVVEKKRTYCGVFFDYFKISAERSAITFNYMSKGQWSDSDLSLPPTIYNGIAINLSSAGTIASVTIDPETNMTGFDVSRISFTAKQIQVDWRNLTFTRKTRVKLDVEVSQAPSSIKPKLTDNPPRL